MALGVLLWWWAARLPGPNVVAAVVVPAALLIGYSRAYLSIHWMSDVVSGWLVATAAAAIVVLADRLVMSRSKRQHPPPHGVALTLAASAAGLSALVIAISGGHAVGGTPPAPEPTRLPGSDVASILSPLPHYSETLLGRHMEPLGLVVVASESTLRAAVQAAGWTVADTPTPGRLLRTYWAGLRNRPDPSAPVTPTFLDSRLQDLAIQQQSLGRGVKARHHARIWRLPLLTAEGCPVWAVTASLDDRVEWTWRTLLPNHHIAPAIDVERDYLADSLSRTGALPDMGRFPLVGPTLGTNAAGDAFFTDGKVALLERTGSC